MKLPQRANHKTMKGEDLLKKAVSKLFQPRSLNLEQTYKNALNNISYERSRQTKGKEEGKER